MVGEPKRNGRSAENGDGAEEAGAASGEAHSAFTPPLGVPLPPVPEDEHPTSEFAVPEGLLTSPPTEFGSAFTPPEGIAKVSLIKPGVPWQDRMRTMLRMPVAERPAPEPAHAAEDGPGPPCRACST